MGPIDCTSPLPRQHSGRPWASERTPGRVVLGYVSVEPWDPTRRVFPLQGGVFPSRPIQSFKLSHMVTGVTRAGGKLKY